MTKQRLIIKQIFWSDVKKTVDLLFIITMFFWAYFIPSLNEHFDTFSYSFWTFVRNSCEFPHINYFFRYQFSNMTKRQVVFLCPYCSVSLQKLTTLRNFCFTKFCKWCPIVSSYTLLRAQLLFFKPATLTCCTFSVIFN